MSNDVLDPKFAAGIAVGSICAIILYGILFGIMHPCNNKNEGSKEYAAQITSSSIELEWSSPTQIKQVFWVEDRSYGSYFWCDTDTGNGGSTMYKCPFKNSRVPRAGEWWDLAINEQGEKYLHSIDFNKTKKENGGKLP